MGWGAEVLEIDLERFAAEHGRGELVIDIREPDEYAAGHVPAAQLMPLARLAGLTGDLPVGRPVYLICATGNRSKTAAGLLRTYGVEAYSVAGGTSGWTATGRPVVTGRLS